RRTGSTGFRPPSRSAPPLERIAGALVVIAGLGGIVAPLLDLLTGMAPVAPLATTSARAVGTVLYVAGMVGTFWAQLAMGDSWRVGMDASERTALVTSGPFAIVRNPIYSLMFLAIAGLALWVPNIVALGSFVLLVASIELQVRRIEEPHLLRVHGDAY